MTDETNTDGKINGGVDDVAAQAKMGADAAPAGEKQSADTAGVQSPDNAQPAASETTATTAAERIAANEKFDNLDDDAKKRHTLYENVKDVVGHTHAEMDKIGGAFGSKARALLDEALVELQKSL